MTSTATESNPLATKPVGRLIVSYAIPSIIAMLVSSLYNIVDQVFIGYGVGYLGNAATTVAFPVITVGLAIALLFGNGCAAYISLKLGERDIKDMNAGLGSTVTVLVIIGVVFMAVGLVFLRPLLNVLGATENIMEYSRQYVSVILIGQPFVIVTIGLSNVIRADGSPKYSMACMLVGAILNTILDPIFIFVFDMGVLGAAIATVLGTVVACTLSIISLFRKGGFIYIRAVKGFKITELTRKSMTKVWSSSLVEQMSMRVGFVLFSMTVARLGTTELAAQTIGMNMMGMSFSFGDGFSVASVTLIGQSLGRKRPDLAKIYGSVCQRTGLIAAFCISFVYVVFGRQIFMLFTDDPGVLSYAAMIMGIQSFTLFLQIEHRVTSKH